MKVCFKATFLFVLILSVITTSLSFVYDSKYKAGNIIFAPTIVYTFAGAGTSSNPYQINNDTDLRNLSTNVNNGTYDFYFDNANGEYNSTPLNYTTSRTDKDVLIELNDLQYYATGALLQNRRYLRPHSGSVIEDSTPYTFYYEFFQYKYVKTLYAYASGICINGGCKNTYNTGEINSN